MKRFLTYSFAICLALAGSCSIDNHAGQRITTVQAETFGTRSALGEKTDGKYPVLWQAGDAIDINGVASNPLPAGFAPARSAAFSFGEAQLGSALHALSPASAMVSYSDGAATVALPSVQTYAAGSFDPAAGLMLGIGTKGDGVHFDTPLCFIKLSINAGSHASHNITKVVLKARGGEKMSGRFTTDYSTLTDTQEGKDSVVLDIPGGIALGSSVVIAYPARVYAHGMALSVEDASGHVMKKVSDSGHSPQAGHIYTSTVSFDAEGGSAFEISELVSEDLDVQWEPGQAAGPKDGSTWQILFIGNSLTLDATHFLPQLLNSAGVTNVELTRTFHGGQTIKGYNDNYTNAAHNSICTWKPGQNGWQGEETLAHSPREAVQMHDYDIVVIQDYPGNSVFWQWDATEQAAVLGLVMKIKADQSFPGPEFVFHLPHSHADWYENTTVKYFNGSSLEMFRTAAATTQHILADTPFDRVISTGAMIQSLRTSVMNLGNDRCMLRGDGVHMDYGFTRYAAGLLIFKVLFTPITGIDYTDIAWRFEEYCPYHATHATPVTDGNIALARAAVEAAVSQPFDATDLSSVPAQTSYTLNPSRAMEMDDNSTFPGAVEFPVVFPLGNGVNNGNTSPYWNGYCIWRNVLQPQAYAKWVMVSLPRTDVVQCHTFANNTDSNISSPSFRGIWTGDYFEFVLPVRNFAAGTKVKFSAPFYERQSPVSWSFEWLDGNEWKSTPFTIGYETTRVEQTATFSSAIEEGYLRLRVKCTDGRVQATAADTTVERDEPYYTSGNEYNSVFYFYDAADPDQAVRFDIIP